MTAINYSTVDNESLYMDISQMMYPLPWRIALWEAILKIVFYVITIILSLIGNSLIIIIVFRYKHMQTPTNYYIVNLAISDLMVTISCSWVHLVIALTKDWVLGDFFCKFNTFAQGMYKVIVCILINLGDREFIGATNIQ